MRGGPVKPPQPQQAAEQTATFLSDVHGNAGALEAVLVDMDHRHVDRIFCLGDLVGYGPEPNEVIDLVRARGIQTILGNYDDGIAFERGGCGCYYATAKARSIGDASYALTAAAVTADRKAWLRTLPRELRLTVCGHRLHLVHGSPRRINEYLLRERDERTFARLAAVEEADVLLFGHTHQAWHRLVGGVLFVNVGSAGRPKDGDPRATYTLLTLRTNAAPSIEVVQVPYDVERTARGVLAAGLPPALADAFREGR